MLPAAWVIAGQRFRRLVPRRRWRCFRDVDVMLAPATPCHAPPLGHKTITLDGVEMPARPNIGLFTQPISFIGLPVVAVPVWRQARSFRSACRSSRRPGARIWRSASPGISSARASSPRPSPQSLEASMTGEARWAGRNSDKDTLRNDVWEQLEATAVNVGPVRAASRILPAPTSPPTSPMRPEWHAARIVKCNPDPPQIPVRLRALYDGKICLRPVPELTKGFPFSGSTRSCCREGRRFRDRGHRAGIPRPWRANVLRGHGSSILRRRLRRRHPPRRSHRQGRRLRRSRARHLSRARPRRRYDPIATTVHSSQVVDDPACRWCRTIRRWTISPPKRELIETRTPYPQPRASTGTTCSPTSTTIFLS